MGILFKQVQDFPVLVRCFTYNHSKYIEDALYGFVSQKTSFPFVCLIIDDASTDGEQEIINRFLERECDMEKSESKQTNDAFVICAPHKHNKNCTMIVYFLEENHYSIKKSKLSYIQPWRDRCKYEALCEGDDYWTDNEKLQKQFEVLEANPDVMMVYTSFDTVNAERVPVSVERYDACHDFSCSGNIFPRLLWKNFVLTLTTCFRKEIYESSLFVEAPARLDYLLFLTATLEGDTAYIAEVTGKYRITSTGAIASVHSQVDKKIKILFQYFILLYCEKKIPRRFCVKDRMIVDISILVLNMTDWAFLKKVFKKRKGLILLVPLAMMIKLAKTLGDRYVPGYTPFKFYKLVFGNN